MKNLNKPSREEVEQLISNEEMSYTIYDEYKEEIDVPISSVRNNAIISVSFKEKDITIIVKSDWSI